MKENYKLDPYFHNKITTEQKLLKNLYTHIIIEAHIYLVTVYNDI